MCISIIRTLEKKKYYREERKSQTCCHTDWWEWLSGSTCRSHCTLSIRVVKTVIWGSAADNRSDTMWLLCQLYVIMTVLSQSQKHLNKLNPWKKQNKTKQKKLTSTRENKCMYTKGWVNTWFWLAAGRLQQVLHIKVCLTSSLTKSKPTTVLDPLKTV